MSLVEDRRQAVLRASGFSSPSLMADTWLLLLAGGSLVLVGFIAAQVFDRFRLPDYFILMSIGLLLGSGLLPLGDFDPRASLASIAPALTNVALAFILFEGGLVLHVRGMAKAWGVAALHTGIAMALAILGMLLVANMLLGLALTTALIIALAFCGPSASIDISLLSQLRVSDRTRFTIIMEGVMGNVVAAVLVLLLIRIPGAIADTSAWFSFLASVSVSVLVAFAVGRIWVAVTGGPRPRRFFFMTSVALAVVLYAVGDGLFGGNGGIAAFVFGLVLGHQRVPAAQRPAPQSAPVSRGLQEFQGELVFLLRTFFFLYLGLRVQLTGISAAALLGAIGFAAVFYASRWPSTALLSRIWRLARRDSRILRATVARGMTDTVLILLAIEVGVIPPGEANLVTNLLFLVIIGAAAASAFLVFRAERLTSLEPRAPTPAVVSGPTEFDRALTEFLEDPIVKQGEID